MSTTQDAETCPRCEGSKVIEVRASMDPAARLIEECCPECEGRGHVGTAEQKAAAAIATLKRLGYTHTGGELWRGPLGKKPNFDLVDYWRGEADALRTQNNQFEHTLAELVDLVSPGLDSGNLLVDAKTAGDQATALRAQVEAQRLDIERRESNRQELVDEIRRIEASHKANLDRLQTIYEHQRGECWYWQGDGQDRLESMVNSLVVVIRAGQLRDLLAPQALTRPAVPEFTGIAQRKLDELVSDGFQVTGYAIQRDSTRGFIDSAGFVGWWTPGVHALAIATIDAMERPAVPEGWKHDCAALLSNDVELWIDACPHCGKPRPALAAAPQPSQQEAVQKGTEP